MYLHVPDASRLYQARLPQLAAERGILNIPICSRYQYYYLYVLPDYYR
jgi:hypothetical protein